MLLERSNLKKYNGYGFLSVNLFELQGLIQ